MSPPLEDAIRQYDHITLMALAVVMNDRDSRDNYCWTVGSIRLPMTGADGLVGSYTLACGMLERESASSGIALGDIVGAGVAEAHYRNYGELRVRLSCDVCAVALDRALEQRVPTPSPTDG